MRFVKAAALATAILLLWSPGWSAAYPQDKVPEFKEMLELKSPSSTAISPDGRFALYAVREPDWKDNSYKSQLWLADISTGESRQMTYSDKSSDNPQWSPCGKYITFVAAREEKPQVYIMNAGGGEARKLTDSKTGVGAYQWSPDGKWIAYAANDDQSKHQKAVEEKYGKFEVIESEYNVSHLWLFDVAAEKGEKLVDREDMHITGFEWSPDSSQIAFSALPDPRAKSFSKSDIYIVARESKEIRPLVVQPGADGSPLWSPCGKFIAFRSNNGQETWFVNSTINVIPREGGEPTCLTEDFDEDAGPVTWKEEGIYFSAFQGMSRHLFLLSPSEKTIIKLTDGDCFVLRGVSLTRDGSRLAFSFTDADRYPEVCWSESKSFEPKALTDFTTQLDGWRLSTKEAISWRSRDGAEITGVLIKPADFDPSKKYPLFVIIHGGPTGISYPQLVDGYSRYYPIEQWCAKGALVLEPNYRGSAGFGNDFRKLNVRNLGVGDYWDVISGVDHLVAQGFVDNDRLGAMGWSQGGYISAYITTFSDRFKAVSVGAGISDWVSYYYMTDITPFTIQYLGATPWDDMDIYRATSPMTHINNAKTPTLIQHGEFDQRVPINNAWKLYRGLMDRRAPVKLIIYKGFGHGITKPKENLAVLTHNWQWFNKYIWGEEPAEEQFEETAEEAADKDAK